MKPTYNLNPAYRYIMTHEITKIISQNYFMLLFSQLTKRKTILNINSETIIYNLINVSRSINHTNNIRGEYSIGRKSTWIPIYMYRNACRKSGWLERVCRKPLNTVVRVRLCTRKPRREVTREKRGFARIDG